MRLEDDGLTVFHAGGGWLFDDHVADRVDDRFETQLLAKPFHELDDSFFLLGRSRDRVELFEMSPDDGGFELCDFLVHFKSLIVEVVFE